MPPTTPRIAGLGAVLWLATACFGWGADGHRITGAIAETYLDEDARSAVKALLGDVTLPDATTWADEIRSDTSYDWAKPLHYVNMPRGSDRYVAARDCGDGRCVVGAIDEFTRRLRDPKTPRDQRVEALKFLVHFIGDVHQPLHACYADDRGGNAVDVTYYGRQTNLHRVWDTDLVKHRSRGDWRGYARAIAAKIDADRVERWRNVPRAGDWATESFAVARRMAYDTDGRIGDTYVERVVPAVEERLAMAGVRMAHALNEIFADAAARPGDEPAPAGAPPADDAPPDDAPPAEGETAPEAPAPESPAVTGDAASVVSLLREGTCGKAGGTSVYILNGDEKRTVRVRVRQTYVTAKRTDVKMRSFVVRPGADHRTRIGCTTRAVRGGVGRFEWELVEAVFR